MPIYEFENIRPVVDPSAFVHPTASLIGDVIVGPACLVGPGASLRGDIGRIVMERGSNVQDNCTVHTFPGKDCIIGPDGHVGHGAVLHGCRLEANAMIGMNAVVMDDVIVAGNSEEVVPREVEARRVDLIAVGGFQSNRATRDLLTRQRQQIVDHAACPVVVHRGHNPG